MKKAIAVLEVGKWYNYNKAIICYTKKENNLLYGYGVNKFGDWIDGRMGNSPEEWKEATQQKVFEALKKEAVKRGYSYNDYSLTLDGYLHGDNGNRLELVFSKGVWAEIIEQEKEEKKPRPNRLEELEKRVEVLENEFKKDSSEFKNVLGGRPNNLMFDSSFGKPDSHNDILTPGAIDTSWLGKEVHELKNPVFGIKVPEYLKELENKTEIANLEALNDQLKKDCEYLKSKNEQLRETISLINNFTNELLDK